MQQREARPAAGTGLRERKKQETRDRLSHVATLLFIERGFDEVTISEIAEAAGVSKMTVTNYFPLKEDLVFDAHELVADSLARVVRERRPGESAHHALHRAYVDALGGAHPVLTGHSSPGFARMVHASARLRAREREIEEQREERLAAALAEETGAAPDDLAPRLAAAQLAAAHRVLFRLVRTLMRADAPQPEADRRAEQAAQEAFALLESSLGDYAVREP
ncbi:TetR family transcriptional regulator [Streptomyces sp. Ru73]|uniref:TetR family transcriptional regulator n=1 Tax=Streptomyces sp. Ru73 TaxID=2080748 RepID=UPI000CDCE78C|nr:TetR/AcrR family transcriptional regulator [Streptomyces sp. Ru73]POX38819.1 TetR family transcriptional regulator [Streptomyces sp. Ru73]